MDVRSRGSPVGAMIARSPAAVLLPLLLALLPFGALCSSTGTSTDGAPRSDGDGAASWSRVVNPFGFVPGDTNVCIRTNLELATDHLTEDELVDMCDAIYRPATCRALSSGDIAVRDLYVRVETYECCDGSLRDGNSCSMVCPTSTYGHNCSLSCSCLNNGACDPADGSCECPPGWTGSRCERTCPHGRYGDRCTDTCHCRDNGTCHPVTGSCLCDYNFAGDSCQVDCGESPGDPGCSSQALCGSCRAAGTRVCDHVAAVCRCRDGWSGRYCAHTCPGASHGEYCEAACRCAGDAGAAAACLPADGSCLCPAGWTGPECDRPCSPGLYGDGCRRRCACPGGGCDHVTGSCRSCPRGWTGESCTLQCEEGRWGANCSRDCNCADSLNCDPISGVCFNIEDRDMDLTTVSGDGRVEPPLGTGEIAAIAGSAALLLALGIVVLVVLRCRSRRKPTLPMPRMRTTPRANGTANGQATLAVNTGRGDATVRYQTDNAVNNSAPTPLPRGPATLPRGLDPTGASDGYETLQQDPQAPPAVRPPAAPTAAPAPAPATVDPYLELYDEIGSAQIDNPVYAAVDADGYEVPSPTLDREARSEPDARTAPW